MEYVEIQSTNTQGMKMQNLSRRKKIALGIMSVLLVAEGGLLIYQNYFMEDKIDIATEDTVLKDRLAIMAILSGDEVDNTPPQKKLEALDKLDLTKPADNTPEAQAKKREEKLRLINSQ